MKIQGSFNAKNILIGIILLFFLIFPFQPTLSASQPAASSDSGCTYMIPDTVDTIDGQGNYSQVKPGDVLCLPAGNRGDIKLVNLHGAEGNPITVRNSGGLVYITGDLFLMGGIGIADSSYLHVTGTGVSSKCGAEYPTDGQECGFELDQTHKGIHIDTTGGNVGNLEIDHIYIHDTSTVVDTRGISIHPLEGQMIDGLYIHHNHIASTSAEGIYVGTEPHNRPLDVLGKEQNVEISYNLLEDIGFDGIKLKEAVSNVKVHQNIINRAGLAGVANHVGGIKLAFSVGDYYNNYIVTGCEGIMMGRVLDNPGTRYFNNIVVGAKCGAITTPEDGTIVYNNTVVDGEPYGISATGKNSQVFDNIVAGTSGTPIDGPDTNFMNNWIGPVSSAGFVNPDGSDYHLRKDSPMIGMGRSIGVFPQFDMDGVSRPIGFMTDLGAYEYPIPFDYLYVPLLLTNRP